jgi:hypothetical protein
MRLLRLLAASVFITSALLAVTGATASIASSAATTEFKGRFTCGDRPLAEARIELLGAPRPSSSGGIFGFIAPLEDHVTSTVKGTAYAGSQGEWSFTVPRTKSVNYYLRAVLDDGRGTIVTEYPSADAAYATPGSGGTNFDDVAVQDYHTQEYPNDECKLWLALKDSVQSYTRLMGKRPPYGDVVAAYGAPNRGVPFAAYTTIVWPHGYVVGSGARARHEFWHTIRNASLGSEDAFLDEVSQQDFRLNSKPCARTTAQYAFHEGWAEFWGRDFWPAPDCFGGKPDDFTVEGNVAWRLTRLALNCSAATPRRMVEVLLAHGPSIHSLADFEKKLGVSATACQGQLDPRSVPREKDAPAVTDDRWAHDLRSALTSVRKRATTLAALLPGADRAAIRARCGVPPCPEAIGRKLAPALIRGQLAQARAAAATLQKQLSLDAQAELRGHPSQTFVDRIRTMPEGLARRLTAIGLDSVTKALADVQPLARRDHSTAARSILGVVRSQRESLVRAQRRSAGFVVGPLGWSGWLGSGPKPNTRTATTAYTVEVGLDNLPSGTILGQTAKDGIVFGGARSLGFPGKLPAYVCELGFEASPFGARTYACGGSGSTFHYSGTLARLTTGARSVAVTVSATYLVPGGIPVELDGFDAAGNIVTGDAVLVGSSTATSGAGLVPKRLALTPPLTSHPIKFIALYVNSAIQTVPRGSATAVSREEPRIAFDRLVYEPKVKP